MHVIRRIPPPTNAHSYLVVKRERERGRITRPVLIYAPVVRWTFPGYALQYSATPPETQPAQVYQYYHRVSHPLIAYLTNIAHVLFLCHCRWA
jgi:hypothetical protein